MPFSINQLTCGFCGKMLSNSHNFVWGNILDWPFFGLAVQSKHIFSLNVSLISCYICYVLNDTPNIFFSTLPETFMNFRFIWLWSYVSNTFFITFPLRLSSISVLTGISWIRITLINSQFTIFDVHKCFRVTENNFSSAL